MTNRPGDLLTRSPIPEAFCGNGQPHASHTASKDARCPGLVAPSAVWDSPKLADLRMTPTDALAVKIGTDLRRLVRGWESSRDRTRQTDLGPSGIGTPCTRCLARHVLGVPVRPLADDPWARILGTATHVMLAEAAELDNNRQLHDAGDPWIRTRWLIEHRVHPNDALLPSGGSLDLYDHETATVIDHKVVGVARQKLYKAKGPGLTYRTQAHTYGHGLEQMGAPVANVAVAFWLRGGRIGDLWVWTEPYDRQVALDGYERYGLIGRLVREHGPAILPSLPADPDCFDCEGRDVDDPDLHLAVTP